MFREAGWIFLIGDSRGTAFAMMVGAKLGKGTPEEARHSNVQRSFAVAS